MPRRGRPIGGWREPGEEDLYARARREAKREAKDSMTRALRSGLPTWRSYGVPKFNPDTTPRARDQDWEPTPFEEAVEEFEEPEPEPETDPAKKRFSGLDFT